MNLSTTSDGQIAINIKSTPDLDGQECSVFIHGSHSCLPVINEKLNNKQVLASINPKDLEDGISRITLFNNLNQPVCERLYFKYPEKKLLIHASVNPEYETREKIDLNLNVTDQSGNPKDADMSLAVYRLDSLQHIDESDIRTYLYLTSDLGPIESPAFYFRDDSVSREVDMDNLMMTNGWRRFMWKDIGRQNSLSLKFPPENYGHIIQGKLIDNITGKPVPDIHVYLSIPSTRTEFRVTSSDEGGSV